MRTQKGFAALEGVLILVIIGMLAGIGWYVMSAQRNTNKALDSAASEKIDTVKVNNGSTKLVIKELGVQMTLPYDLKGVIYTAQTITSFDGTKSTAIYLDDKDYANDIAKCYNQAPEPLNFGAIGKTDGQYPKDANIENTDGALLKQYPNFYFNWSVPNGITTCSNDQVDPSLVQYDAHKLQDSFVKAFKDTATLVN